MEETEKTEGIKKDELNFVQVCEELIKNVKEKKEDWPKVTGCYYTYPWYYYPTYPTPEGPYPYQPCWPYYPVYPLTIERASTEEPKKDKAKRLIKETRERLNELEELLKKEEV